MGRTNQSPDQLHTRLGDAIDRLVHLLAQLDMDPTVLDVEGSVPLRMPAWIQSS